MKKNVGKVDRIIRIIGGLFLISLVFWGPRTLWGLIGVIPLLSGLTGYCPAYSLLGISTCPLEESSTSQKEG